MEAFIANYRNLELEKDYKKYFKYLNNYEKNRSDRYVKVEDKARYILGILLMKGILLKNTNLNELFIKNNLYGKPYIENAENTFFNISHSNDLVAIIIGEKEVGIDIEYVKKIDIESFKNILNADEVKLIESSKNRFMKFYEIWTVKECFSKEEGIGLSILDRNFTINYENNTIEYENKILNFKTYNFNNYKMSICSELNCNNTKVSILDKEKLMELISFIKRR